MRYILQFSILEAGDVVKSLYELVLKCWNITFLVSNIEALFKVLKCTEILCLYRNYLLLKELDFWYPDEQTLVPLYLLSPWFILSTININVIPKDPTDGSLLWFWEAWVGGHGGWLAWWLISIWAICMMAVACNGW